MVSRYDSKLGVLVFYFNYRFLSLLLGKHSDRLVGLCGRGKIYVVDNANHMKVAEDIIE